MGVGGLKIPLPLGPCRRCGVASWTRDLLSPIHRCCAWYALRGEAKCGACSEARTAASRRSGRRIAPE